MGWIKNTLIFASFLTAFLFPKIAKTGTISQKVWDAHDGTNSNGTEISCWINNGSSGTQNTNVYPLGLWWVDSGNFSPAPMSGDTIKSVDSLDTGTKVYTSHMREIWPGVEVIMPTGFLDDPDKNVRAHSFGSWVVNDTSGIADTLRAEGWLKKNSDQTIPYINYFLNKVGGDSTLVDTSDLDPHIAINLEEQDSLWQQGDSVFVRVYKERNDSTWETTVGFPLDTLKHGCATLLEQIIFPDTVYENDQTAPNITNVTEWSDTTYSGPFLVEATITDDSGISEAWLKFRIGASPVDSANQDSTVGNMYYFTIPLMAPPDTVQYQVKAIDGSPNQNVAYWPGPSQNEWWSFYVYTVGVEEKTEKNAREVIIIYPTIGSRFTVVGAENFIVYDICGRKVKECEGAWNGRDTRGKVVSEGIYFIKADGQYVRKVVKVR